MLRHSSSLMDSNSSFSPAFWFNSQSNCVSAVFALKGYFWTMFSAGLFSCTLPLCWHGLVCQGPPHTGAVYSLPHDLWSTTGFTGTTLKTWPHVLPMNFIEQIFKASSRLGRYLLVIYLVGNAGSYTKLSSSWGYPMETNLSTVRSNPRDSYSGDLYTVPRWDFS